MRINHDRAACVPELPLSYTELRYSLQTPQSWMGATIFIDALELIGELIRLPCVTDVLSAVYEPIDVYEFLSWGIVFHFLRVELIAM